jgi:hypothetical protein
MKTPLLPYKNTRYELKTKTDDIFLLSPHGLSWNFKIDNLKLFSVTPGFSRGHNSNK